MTWTAQTQPAPAWSDQVPQGVGKYDERVFDSEIFDATGFSDIAPPAQTWTRTDSPTGSWA